MQQQLDNKEGSYELLEAVRGMDDRWRRIIGICAADRGVELVGLWLLGVLECEAHVSQGGCDMPLRDRLGWPGSQCRQ